MVIDNTDRKEKKKKEIVMKVKTPKQKTDVKSNTDHQPNADVKKNTNSSGQSLAYKKTKSYAQKFPKGQGLEQIKSRAKQNQVVGQAVDVIQNAQQNTPIQHNKSVEKDIKFSNNEFNAVDRLNNMFDVLSIALGFKEGNIVSNTDNKVFNTGAEYMANHPYASAGILAGGLHAAKSVVAGSANMAKSASGKLVGNIASIKKAKLGTTTYSTINEAARYGLNTKTANISTSIISDTLAEMQKPLFVLGAISAAISTYGLAGWAEVDNVKGGINFAVKSAMQTKNPEMIKQAVELQNQVYDPDMLTRIGQKIPFLNLATAYKRGGQVALMQSKIAEQASLDILEQENTGMSDEQTISRFSSQLQDKYFSIQEQLNQKEQIIKVWKKDKILKSAARKNLTSQTNTAKDIYFLDMFGQADLDNELSRIKKDKEKQKQIFEQFYKDYIKTYFYLKSPYNPELATRF